MSRPGKELSRKQFLNQKSSQPANDAVQVVAMDDQSASLLYHANGFVSTGVVGFKPDIVSENREDSKDRSLARALAAKPEMALIYAELKFICDRYREEDKAGEVTSDWTFAAMVIDRLCLYVFVTVTVVSTAAILLSAPNIFAGSEGT